MDFKVTNAEMPSSIPGYYFPYNLTNNISQKQKSQFSEEITQQTQSFQGWDGNNSNNCSASFFWDLQQSLA